VDYTAHSGGNCDYFAHYHHCRPWPTRPHGGCAGKSTTPREPLDGPLVTWDTERARELARIHGVKWEALKKIAKELDCSVTALDSWVHREKLDDKRWKG
jgi:hypothetical protein